MTDPAVLRGLKLLELYRRGVGGERDNAGRLLHKHLRLHDLTLYDLDTSLPVTQSVDMLDQWRESAALVAKLPADDSGEILTQLIDATDLTDSELRTVMARLDLEKLAQTRSAGWAHSSGVAAADLERAARRVTPDMILGGAGSLAQRFLGSALREHWTLTHPERLLRASDPLTQRLILGLVRGLTGHPGRLDPEGVRAHLGAPELARIRTMIAQDLDALGQQALTHAETLAATFAQRPS